ncbi:MAG TPA: acetamidase/formamidase family protein [Burkholderiales bacterium]|jgi:acetamidase/formamidase|nr:acetamidase/formamidase family protein [Burkholderiales bacterium]
MNIPRDKSVLAATTHLLRSTPETVHWGFFDASLPPVLTVDSGDRVVIECVSGNPEWLPPKTRGFKVPPELLDIHAKVKRGTGNHILTGPVFVRGAAIGDVLEIQILEIGLRQDWAYNLFRRYMGTLPGDYPYYRLIHIALDEGSNMAVLPSGLRVPMRPFFGQLGVAPPAEAGRQNSKEPREFGGNIDCKELVAGSTVFLPVLNEGALFSTGDGHAIQGDGEVNGTAAETALEGTFEFRVRKDLEWRLPRAETPTHYLTFGLDADLDDAARQALREMLQWIVDLTGISRDEAYALGSLAVDLHVTQTVNNIKGVHAMLNKNILRKPT